MIMAARMESLLPMCERPAEARQNVSATLGRGDLSWQMCAGSALQSYTAAAAVACCAPQHDGRAGTVLRRGLDV